MHQLLLAIRDNPTEYLPEPSLNALQHFRNGYLSRSSMEGRTKDLGVNWREFHTWLLDHYQMPFGRAIADTMIVNSFFLSEESAFKEYFDLLSEFLSSESQDHVQPSFQTERRTLIELLRSIRKQPALYLGQATFLGLCSNLMGDERACRDIGLLPDEGRRTFSEFQAWIESEKNRSGRRRPWFKVIQFWSGGFDCGSENSGSFSLFFKWLDEFSESIGQNELFRD